jgi:hypothetical protein
MKTIRKFLWFYFEWSFAFLNREEAILHFLASDPRFHEDKFRPYDYFYSIFIDDKFEGYVAKLCNEWVICTGKDAIIGDLAGVKSVRDIKRIMKKYTK